MRFRARPVMVATALLAGALGCGSDLATVRGKVAFEDGKPLPEGTVFFRRVISKDEKGYTAQGTLKGDGSFELRAPAGKYQVMIDPEGEKVRNPNSAPAFDARYMGLETSGLEFEVKGGSNEIPITITRPGKTPKNK